MKRLLSIIVSVVCLAGSCSGQTFTFSCICNADMTGADCDVCLPSGLTSRSFTGLLIYRNGVANKWIDEPYTSRVRANETIEFLEQVPNGDKITIARFQTPFTTMQGFIDSTFCQCNAGGSLSVVVDTPLVGDGSGGDPLTIGQFGADASMVLKWNGSHWYPGNVSAAELINDLPEYASDSAAIADGLSVGDVYILSCDNAYGDAPGIWKTVKLCGGCALSVGFYESDALATSGSIAPGKEYALSASNVYGLLYGFVKAVTNGTYSGGSQVCTTSLPEHASDAAALTGGLSIGDYYKLATANIYGAPSGVVRVVSTSATTSADAQICCEVGLNLPFYASDAAATGGGLAAGSHYYLSTTNIYGFPDGTRKVLQGFNCSLATSFFDSDALAYSSSVPLGKGYALGATNIYGLLYGFVKAVTNGTYSTGTQVCTTVLPEHASDAAALTGGLSVGDFYELTAANIYGAPDGMIRMVSASGTTSGDAMTCCDSGDNLPFYASDAAAMTGGLSAGSHYYLSSTNIYGYPDGSEKVIQ